MSSKAVKKQSRKAGKTKPGQRAAPIRDSNKDWIPACAGTSGVKHFDLGFTISDFRFIIVQLGLLRLGGQSFRGV